MFQKPVPVGSLVGATRLVLLASTCASLMPNGDEPVGALMRRLPTTSGRLLVSFRNW